MVELMKRNTINHTTIHILILMLLSTLFVFSTQTTLAQTSKFPLDEVIAVIQPVSPDDNMTYVGVTPLNLTVHYKVQASSPNASIPYEDITCIYQLDDNDWANASLSCASPQTFWYDPTFQGYWVEIDCNYTATLPELADGTHSLNVKLTPDINYYYRVLSNGSSVIVRIENSFYNALAHEPINFTIVNDDNTVLSTNTVPSNDETGQTFTTVLIVIVVLGIAIAISLALIKCKKDNE